MQKYKIHVPYHEASLIPPWYYEQDAEYRRKNDAYWELQRKHHEEFKKDHPEPLQGTWEERSTWFSEAQEYSKSFNEPPVVYPQNLQEYREKASWDLTVADHNKSMIRLKRPTIKGFLVYSPMYREGHEWPESSRQRWLDGMSHGDPQKRAKYEQENPPMPYHVETVESSFKFLAAKMSTGKISRYFIWRGLMRRDKNLPKYWSEILTLIP